MKERRALSGLSRASLGPLSGLCQIAAKSACFFPSLSAHSLVAPRAFLLFPEARGQVYARRQLPTNRTALTNRAASLIASSSM